MSELLAAAFLFSLFFFLPKVDAGSALSRPRQRATRVVLTFLRDMQNKSISGSNRWDLVQPGLP
jgi:hypothetical protein